MDSTYTLIYIYEYFTPNKIVLCMYFPNLFYMLSLTMGTVVVVLLYTPLLPYTPQCLCHTQMYSDKGRPTQGRCHLQTLGNGARLE